MKHRNANRPGRASGGDRGGPRLHGAKRAAAGGDAPAARAARGRRPKCGPDGESSGGPEDGSTHPRRGAVRQTSLDREAFDVLIVQQWTKTLRGPYDWGDWPLARYTLGAGVLSAAERYAGGAARCEGSAVDHLAWVCAMVACGRAPRLRSIRARPRGEGSGETSSSVAAPERALAGAAAGVRGVAETRSPTRVGVDEQQLVRADGACAWRCNVERDVLDGPQLHYWIHPSGLVEFEAVSGVD
jgi:hypothetical protein